LAPARAESSRARADFSRAAKAFSRFPWPSDASDTSPIHEAAPRSYGPRQKPRQDVGGGRPRASDKIEVEKSATLRKPVGWTSENSDRRIADRLADSAGLRLVVMIGVDPSKG
jgi:hypothetical protein